METFKNCKPINTNIVASIGGFGNGTVDMAIYKINNFVITNNKQSITYKELYSYRR